jgi:DNA-binding transcriptional MerR regulator
VAHDGLLSIGAFSLLSGLSIAALRHYDEVGLLEPASVDPETGYRSYRREQARLARLIRALRRIELPLESVRRIVEAGDDESLRTVLATHREHLSSRADELAQMLCLANQLSEKGIGMTATASSRVVQVKIAAKDVQESVGFYEQVFGATYDEGISSFAFGTYPSDQFFLLTLEGEETSRFGLLVDDVDAAHARALAAGATEREAPHEVDWKPRSSSIVDPGGNRVDLYQS